MSAGLIFAQSVGGEASTVWGLLAVVVVVGGGIVTTLLVQRRRHATSPTVDTSIVQEQLLGIITDLRGELTAKQEQCDAELRNVRRRYGIEIGQLQRRLNDCQARLERES